MSLGIHHERIHIDVDTTVETVYGLIQGAKRGHNPGHRGKKGLRPVLAFVAETREYLAGKLRRGETISGREVAQLILSFGKLVPSCVKRVIVRMDAEMYSWAAVKACLRLRYEFIISAKRTRPPFDPKGWYSVGRNKEIQYNHCFFQPSGWEKACRFVAQRIPKEKESDPREPVQFELFEDDRYKYRIFVTSLPSKPHQVIQEYDGRAGAESLIGEAKREGLAAIPTQKFQSNQAYFQIVMFSYNLWRYMIAFAHLNDQEQKTQNTIHVSRLKLLFIAAKIVSGKNRIRVNYSSHLSGKERLDRLIHNLDILRKHPEILNSPIYWHQGCQLPMQKIFCMKNVA
ncbi:MAG: transposase [Deltaproteobacteria bacterium]|nr:transposase [Deltaproteobacteria bacterium]